VHDGIEDNNDADTVHLYRTADYDKSDVSNWVESDDTDSEDTDLEDTAMDTGSKSNSQGESILNIDKTYLLIARFSGLTKTTASEQKAIRRLRHHVRPSFCQAFQVPIQEVEDTNNEWHDLPRIISTRPQRRTWLGDLCVCVPSTSNMFDRSALAWRKALRGLLLLHRTYNFNGKPQITFIGEGIDAFSTVNNSWACALDLLPKFDVDVAMIVPLDSFYSLQFPQLTSCHNEDGFCGWQRFSTKELDAAAVEMPRGCRGHRCEKTRVRLSLLEVAQIGNVVSAVQTARTLRRTLWPGRWKWEACQMLQQGRLPGCQLASVVFDSIREFSRERALQMNELDDMKACTTIYQEHTDRVTRVSKKRGLTNS
jgi:hypothetical protein